MSNKATIKGKLTAQQAEFLGDFGAFVRKWDVSSISEKVFDVRRQTADYHIRQKAQEDQS